MKIDDHLRDFWVRVLLASLFFLSFSQDSIYLYLFSLLLCSHLNTENSHQPKLSFIAEPLSPFDTKKLWIIKFTIWLSYPKFWSLFFIFWKTSLPFPIYECFILKFSVKIEESAIYTTTNNEAETESLLSLKFKSRESEKIGIWNRKKFDSLLLLKNIHH